ncbi:hypothetical protein [Sphingomonas montana]|uniref:hypothetical protein n=1 Tax=Sphingomonas montana TaxID=1843236 RepID=UPI00096F8238|nr:hypothetical protein [Sphingomonas montana]
MITLASYGFEPDKACIVCRHVIDGAPILVFVHDDDGDLQFACGGEAHSVDDWHAICLDHVDLAEHRLNRLPAVHAGHVAIREEAGGDWSVEPTG